MVCTHIYITAGIDEWIKVSKDGEIAYEWKNTYEWLTK